MLTTLGLENQISQTMDRIRLSALVLGQLTSLYGMTGLGQPRISQALSGAKPFDNLKGQQLLNFVREIERMRDYYGVPLMFNDSARIKQMLDARRQAQKLLEEI